MGWVVKATPRVTLPLGRRHSTHSIGGWVDPRAGLKGRGKSRLYRGSILGPSIPCIVTMDEEE